MVCEVDKEESGRRAILLVVVLLIALGTSLAFASRRAETPVAATGPDSHDPPTGRAYSLASPSGQVRIRCGLARVGDAEECFVYSVWLGDRELIKRSRLGLVLSETGPLASSLRIAGVVERSHDETWPVPVGKSSSARDHYRELTVNLEERSQPGRRVEVVFRAYDDGVAFRYRLPEQGALADFTITSEASEFAVAGEPRAYVLPLNSFTTPYEDLYVPSRVDEITPDTLAGLPLLLEHADGTCLAITEADLSDYGGMYVSGAAGRPGVLMSALSPWPGQPEIKVKARAPHVSPWRVVMIGGRPGVLIESNLLLNLSRPSAIADVSWIKPGKIAFPWLNGYVVKNAGFKAGLNTATIKFYIDFCAANGIEYASLDGWEQEGAWYGGPLFPEGPVDITTARAGLDLAEVLRYAKEKGVRIRVWLHWKALEPQIDEAFARYEQLGIEGVMVDFMDRDDQEMVKFYHEVLRKAAEHRLTVTFHGSFKPTGIRRTYPNLLNYEAVFNLEHNKGFRFGCPPEHNLTVPFTRMLAGPLDYHQGVLRTTTQAAYRPIWHGPEMMGTECHQLAMYVVYENYLPMVGDFPEAYADHAAGLELIAELPVTWDETRVIDGRVGDYITIARRKGRTWYVGSMTDGTARTLNVPLAFLGDGEFVADVYADDPDAAHQPAPPALNRRAVSARDTLELSLAPAGGSVVRLSPR